MGLGGIFPAADRGASREQGDSGRESGERLLELAGRREGREIGVEGPLKSGHVARGLDHAREQFGLPAERFLVSPEPSDGRGKRLGGLGPAVLAAEGGLVVSAGERISPAGQAFVECRGEGRPDLLAPVSDQLPHPGGGGLLEGPPGLLLRFKQASGAVTDRLAEPGHSHR